MKNIFKNLAKIFVLSFIALTVASCGGDDEVEAPTANAPTLNITPDRAEGSSYDVGEEVNITFNFTAEAKLSGFNYYLVLNEGEADEQESNKVFNSPTNLPITSDTSDSFGFIFPVDSDYEGKTVTLHFEIVDLLNQTITASYGYTVNVNITTSTQVLVGGFSNSSLGSFYDAMTNTVYLSADAISNSEKIDLLFYYADTPGYTIAALDNAEANVTIKEQTNGDLDNFTTQNMTRFKTFLIAPDFANINTNSELENAYAGDANTSDESRIKSLAEGDIFGFTLATSRGSKIGLIKVMSTDGSVGSDRAIELTVKIQN